MTSLGRRRRYARAGKSDRLLPGSASICSLIGTAYERSAVADTPWTLVENVKWNAIAAGDYRARARYADPRRNLKNFGETLMGRSAGNGTSNSPGLEQSEKRDDASPTDAAAPAGRIVHDERGNAVWNWSKADNSIGSTSQMLKKLQLTDLRVEGEAPPVKEPETKRGESAKRGESGYGPGYNPYDRTAPVRKPPAPKKGQHR